VRLIPSYEKHEPAFDLKAFLATGNGGGSVQTYKKSEVIFSQGDRCDGVFYIHSGDCKVSVTSEQGKEAVVALHGKGDFFGEGCLSGQPLRLATATAMSGLEVMRLDNAAIQRVLHEEPEFSELFISHLLSRNARV
jgi:CRP/FNR family cyclic AMP-dependent transcriptional regulator